jgi:hypothetical protein
MIPGEQKNQISRLEFDSSRSRYPRYPCEVRRFIVVKSDSKTAAYEIRTKSGESGGLETKGRRDRVTGLGRPIAVRRFVREARGYWASMRAQKAAENVRAEGAGGARGTGIQHSPPRNTRDPTDADDLRHALRDNGPRHGGQGEEGSQKYPSFHSIPSSLGGWSS